MTSLGGRMLIDGQLYGLEGRGSFHNLNPATEEVIGQIPEAGAADFERAIGAARRAFDTSNWSIDAAFRRHCLTQLQSTLREHAEELRDLVVAEVGSPVSLTRGIQLDGPIEFISHYIGLLGSYEFERSLPDIEAYGGVSSRLVRREAAGVVAAITPWNYPLYLAIAKVSAALAAGCTVVLKPAPDTPATALALGELAAQHTDLPAGVLNILTTTDNSLASILTSHPDVDAVTLTGSTATGRKVMAAASETIKRVTLELGGKSAAVLLEDAEVSQVVPMVAGTVCVHAGQGCAALTRLVVPRSKYDEAVAMSAAVLEQVSWGDPTDPANLMGPVINARQRDSVLAYFESARRDGRIVLGGNRSDRHERGYYVEPTLIADVDVKSAVAQEEIFGPALVVLAYDDEADALRIADSTIFGLSGAVYSPDTERALNFARRMRSGTVGVNGGNWFDVASPFGGYKQSGLGREWGTEGLEDFLEVKTIAFPASAATAS
jgi:aldehyde dehydrogenase (NAD+)